MKILIFGSRVVGRYYAKYFLEKNDEVIIVDNIAKLTGGVHPKIGNYLILINLKKNLNL